MTEPLELILRRDQADESHVLLCSPDLGLFTAARPKGALLMPGDSVGYLSRLGLARRILVPTGAVGRVVNENPERVHAPVEYGQVLYRLGPVGAGLVAAAQVSATATQGSAELVITAPQTGRFWHRPAPEDAAFCGPGDELELGSPIGLIEIMKTFTQVAYQPGGNLPARVRVVRLYVPDGGEVTEDEPLLEVEPL